MTMITMELTPKEARALKKSRRKKIVERAFDAHARIYNGGHPRWRYLANMWRGFDMREMEAEGQMPRKSYVRKDALAKMLKNRFKFNQ